TIATVFTSRWREWQKTPKTERGGTAKTDKTSVEEKKPAKTERGGTAKTDKTSVVLLPPCAVCGGVPRWNDHGVQRCQTCWPTPLTRRALEAEQAEQTRRRVR